MRYCAIISILLVVTTFGYTQENTFTGSWELTEVTDPENFVLPKITEQYLGKRFHFLPEWLIIEDEDGYFLTPLQSTENTAHYGQATLTLIEQTADTLRVSLQDDNYLNVFKLGFSVAPPLEEDPIEELLRQPTIINQNGLKLQGFYFHFDEPTKEYTYFRFYPDSTLTRSVSELPPALMALQLNQATTRRETVTFSRVSEGEKLGAVAHFSAPPQIELNDLHSIVYQDFILQPQQDSIFVTKNTHYNIANDLGNSEQFTLTFYPTANLSYRLISELGKRYVINYRSLAGMSSFKENPYYLTSELPRFPGCEELTDPDEKQSCAQKALMTFIYRRLKYPDSAIRKGIEGTTIVEFTVQPDGSVAGIKLLRSVSPECDQEALRTIAKMHYENIRWIPGKHDGIPIEVPFVIPITFRLQ